jgi:integrase
MPARLVSGGPEPWNKGLLVGQKKPLEPKHVWSIRVRLEIALSKRDLAIFNLAIDSKLRACDLVGNNVRHRATIVQKKTGRPVQFETEQSRSSIETWLPTLRAIGSRYLFPSRLHASPHISTRQYSRLVHHWVESIGLEAASYGTHSCGVQRPHKSIAKPATCAQCNCSSVTRSWKAPSDISGLR